MNIVAKFFIAAFVSFYAARALAQDSPPAPPPAKKICQLGQVASLDVKTGAEGMIFVNGDLDGRQGDFLIDTGGMGMVLNLSTAASMKLAPNRAFTSAVFVGGTKLDYTATAKRLKVGNTTMLTPWFFVAPDGMFPSDAMGNIQPHAFWQNHDLEIDFAKGKLNVFVANQCPGNVVYWTHEPYASVPMKPDTSGHVEVEAVLDGKAVSTLIDTGSQNSFISLKAASHVLDLDEDSKGVEKRSTVVINNEVRAKRYRFPFQSLTFEGIAIQHPKIEIDDTGADSRRDPLILGIGVLRQLHLFLAYDENRLYLTSAEAR